MSKPQVFRTHVQLPGYKYLYLLACVTSWDEYRNLVAAAGYAPPSGKPKDVKAPRDEAELAAKHPGVLLTKDMDDESAEWAPVRSHGG